MKDMFIQMMDAINTELTLLRPGWQSFIAFIVEKCHETTKINNRPMLVSQQYFLQFHFPVLR